MHSSKPNIDFLLNIERLEVNALYVIILTIINEVTDITLTDISSL